MSGSDSAGEKAPLGRTRTAAEGLDPGALPMRWGEESMGVVLAGADNFPFPLAGEGGGRRLTDEGVNRHLS